MGLKHSLLTLWCCGLLLLSTVANSGNTAATHVQISTSHGTITLELFDQKAPETVRNFLKYVDAGHYNNTIFHRVIPRFMIQGGGFTAEMHEKPTAAPIKNESKNRLHNERGTIAMARTSDPHSATAQFFINVRMNISLDYRMGQYGYAVFGKVIEGMDVVDTISIQKTGRRGMHDDVPEQAIFIKSISRISQ